MSNWLGFTGAIKFVNNGIDTDKSKIQLNDYMSEVTEQFTESNESTFEWDLVDNTDCASYTLVINANIIDMEMDNTTLLSIRNWLDKYIVTGFYNDKPISFMGIIHRGIFSFGSGLEQCAFNYRDDTVDGDGYWRYIG